MIPAYEDLLVLDARVRARRLGRPAIEPGRGRHKSLLVVRAVEDTADQPFVPDQRTYAPMNVAGVTVDHTAGDHDLIDYLVDALLAWNPADAEARYLDTSASSKRMAAASTGIS